MKVLIADDEMGVKTLLKHFIEQYPSPYIEYKMASSGEEMRNLCLQKSFDIVFSDIKMPGLSGLEAIYEIKHASKNDNTSYYIISGYGEFEFAQQAIRLGIKDTFGESGTVDELMNKYGLTSKALYEAIK